MCTQGLMTKHKKRADFLSFFIDLCTHSFSVLVCFYRVNFWWHACIILEKEDRKFVGSDREGKRKTGSWQALSGKGGKGRQKVSRLSVGRQKDDRKLACHVGRQKEDRELAGSEWEGKRKTQSYTLRVGRQKEDTKLHTLCGKAK